MAKSKLDRLTAILEKVNPALAASHAATGRWDGKTTKDVEAEEAETAKDPKAARRRRAVSVGAPYSIMSTDRGVTIKVTGEDGDTVAGKGKTREDALTHLEQKLGIKEEK